MYVEKILFKGGEPMDHKDNVEEITLKEEPDTVEAEQINESTETLPRSCENETPEDADALESEIPEEFEIVSSDEDEIVSSDENEIISSDEDETINSDEDGENFEEYQGEIDVEESEEKESDQYYTLKEEGSIKNDTDADDFFKISTVNAASLGGIDGNEEYEEEEDEEEKETEVKEKAPKKKREIGSRRIDSVFDFLELFIFTFVFVLLVTSFVFRHSVVSGPSMMNTLQDGDKLIISNLFYTPEYRDIIVVQDYSAGMTDPIVKRVIATEGQTVRISNEGISVDGQLLNEDYLFTDGREYSHLSRLDHGEFKDCENYRFVPGQFCEFTVPEDELFVLGDHRNISQDSHSEYGNVREDAVLGKVILRFYPNFKFFKD